MFVGSVEEIFNELGEAEAEKLPKRGTMNAANESRFIEAAIIAKVLEQQRKKLLFRDYDCNMKAMLSREHRLKNGVLALFIFRILPDIYYAC